MTTYHVHSGLGGGAKAHWKVLKREFESAAVYIFNLSLLTSLTTSGVKHERQRVDGDVQA